MLQHNKFHSDGDDFTDQTAFVFADQALVLEHVSLLREKRLKNIFNGIIRLPSVWTFERFYEYLEFRIVRVYVVIGAVDLTQS